MKHIKILSISLLIFFSHNVFAQNLKGKVSTVDANGKTEALSFATIQWAGTTIGVSTDADGRFSIKKLNKDNAKLVASFIGYTSDTLTIPQNAEQVEFLLYEEVLNLEGAVVRARQKGSYVSKLTPVKMDVITAAGLCKMACCSLAESFENTASISVGYSDAVSGARQIRMLGLSGTYTQMLDENIPSMRGIASTYGMSFTPGQWLESIQVSKGTSSVLNGTDGISGQINLEHRKPNLAPPLFVNLYGDLDERAEVNIASGIKINEKLSTVIFAHGAFEEKYHDMNHDGFADMPAVKRVNFGNRWLYMFGDDKPQLRFGVSYLSENRKGGQRLKNRPANPYLSEIDNSQFRAYTKLGIPFTDISNLSFILNYVYHNQKSMFGAKNYDANQNSFYGIAMWKSSFDKDEKHRYTLGLNYTFDKYNERFGDDIYADSWNGDRNESVYAALAEYTFKPNEKLDIIAGARIDHNRLYKETTVTPRAHLRYNFLEKSTVRLSFGRGVRSPNVIADNIGMLATGRRVVIGSDIKQEKAWTYGASFTQDFRLNDKQSGYISFDVFRTSFQNQTVVDVEASDQYISISNLNGSSFANSFQVDFSIDPIERFNVFATFRYNKTKVDMSQGFVEKPLVDRFKALINLAYATKFEKWQFDFTAQLNGSSRLPNHAAKEWERSRSKIYPMFFAQITKRFKNIDIYVGCENIGDYTQKKAIIGAENPFDKKFDASSIYAPLMGRKIYAGVRITIE